MNIRNIGGKTKILSLFMLVFTVSLLIQLLIIIPYMQDSNLQQASSLHEEIAFEITSEGENGLKVLESALVAMADQSVFRTMDIDNQTETMMQYIELNPQINSLSVMNSTGWFVTGTMEGFIFFTTQSFAESSYFSIPFQQNKTNFGTPFSHTDETVGMSVSVPIKSYTEEIIGVLMGSVTLNEVIYTIHEYTFEQGTFAYLVDQRGIVLAHSVIDIFNLDGGPLSLNYSSFHIVEDAMAGTGNIIDVCDHVGKPYLAIAVALELVNRYMILETPLDVILAESYVLTTNLLQLNLFVFVFGIIVTLALAQRIVTHQD